MKVRIRGLVSAKMQTGDKEKGKIKEISWRLEMAQYCLAVGGEVD
jgi:hypothetical protein